jgi:hypothetical protein
MNCHSFQQKGKGVAKEETKKDNPFITIFASRKEFLLLMYDNAKERARQLPVPT